MLTSTLLACDKLCTLPLSQTNESYERLHEPKAHALNDTNFGSQPKHPCSHPQTHACRHYTSRVCVCVCAALAALLLLLLPLVPIGRRQL